MKGCLAYIVQPNAEDDKPESKLLSMTRAKHPQASDALSDSISKSWMALLISVTAGVSEEIAFRGALQPIFGLWPTALIFALFHLQYTLTPATLIILFVADY